MRRTIVVAALLVTACGPIGWLVERSGCGLKCPRYSSCRVVQSGVFTASYGCVCDYGTWQYPSADHPCPAPSPSPAIHPHTVSEPRTCLTDAELRVIHNAGETRLDAAACDRR